MHSTKSHSPNPSESYIINSAPCVFTSRDRAPLSMVLWRRRGEDRERTDSEKKRANLVPEVCKSLKAGSSNFLLHMVFAKRVEIARSQTETRPEHVTNSEYITLCFRESRQQNEGSKQQAPAVAAADMHAIDFPLRS